MKRFILAAIVALILPATAAAQCHGPNCPQAQYIQTPTIMPWNWGSRVIRLRRVRPPVTLQYGQQQQAPREAPREAPRQEGQWQFIPGRTQEEFQPYITIPQAEYDGLRQRYQAPQQ